MKIKLTKDEYQGHVTDAMDSMHYVVFTQWQAMEARPSFEVFFEEAYQTFKCNYFPDPPGDGLNVPEARYSDETPF